MLAIIGMFFQDGLTGSAWGDSSLYTDSPLRARLSRRAFESELGVQAPVGLGKSRGIHERRRRGALQAQTILGIKPCRMCMIATMGYSTPEIAGKPPGCLSPVR